MCILSNIRIRIIGIIKMIYINDDTPLKVIDLLSGDFYVNWYSYYHVNQLAFLNCDVIHNNKIIYDYSWITTTSRLHEKFNLYYHDLHKFLFLHPEFDITEENMRNLFSLIPTLHLIV